MNGHSQHARTRAQQRGIPPLVEQWLDEFGEETYDGHGGVVRHFSHKARRRLERRCGRGLIHRLAVYMDAYKVEGSRDGHVITIGHRHKRIKRK